MNRREFIRTTGLGLAALATPGVSSSLFAQTPGAKPPNIILILTDDVGLGIIGCYGSDVFKTPHIDRLAATGTRFEYCYSAPVCGPSRCQLLTGRYPFRTGLNSNRSGESVTTQSEVMIPAILKSAGYVNGYCGKWDTRIRPQPGEWGFDEYLYCNGSGKFWGKQAPQLKATGGPRQVPEGAYNPDLFQEFATEFITRHKDRPFFLHYSVLQLHTPVVRTADSKPDSKTLYFDNVAYMDKVVGQLTVTLEQLKLRENTVVLFVGDNGTAAAAIKETGMRDASLNGGKYVNGMKSSMLEGGSRVPLIVSWPGTTPAGAVNGDLTDFSDFFPTFAELAGASMPEGRVIDGRSFAPQIRGRKGQPREWVYVEHNGQSYVRNRRWKLTHRGAMFDMKDAPYAEISVPMDAGDPEILAARKALQAVLDKHPALPATDSREHVSE